MMILARNEKNQGANDGGEEHLASSDRGKRGRLGRAAVVLVRQMPLKRVPECL